MYSIILAAGSGTRMAPLSHYIPKLLMPIRGKPILLYILDNMKGLPIDTNYVVASKHLNTINLFLEKTGLDNVKAIQALGWETGGDLSIAMEEINKVDDVVVMNGDLITDASVLELWNFHKEKGAEVSMALFPVKEADEAKRLGVVEIDENNKVVKFTEKPKELKKLPVTVNTGIYIFSKKFMEKRHDYLTPKKFKLEEYLFPRLVEEGKLYGHISKLNYWWDVGTHESYLKAEDFIANKTGIITSKSDPK